MSESPEFVSEAQEIIESYSRQLLEIEGQIRDGADYDPDLLNGAFRAVHTLKSLAALFGFNDIVDLSHKLENTLDALRLGKLPLNQPALDLLFESVELFQSMLAHIAEGEHGPSPADVERFLGRLAQLVDMPEAKGPDPLAWLDDSILGVLTEYEEHRLRENVRLGRRIFRVHASFDLLAIDKGIDSLKQRLKNHGEVITYLPSADASSDDRIELDILVGSKSTLAAIAEGIDEDGVGVEALGTNERIIIRKQAAPEPVKPEPARPEPAKPKSTTAQQAAAQRVPAQPATPVQPAMATPARSEPAKPQPAKPEPSRAKVVVEAVDDDDELGFAEAAVEAAEARPRPAASAPVAPHVVPHDEDPEGVGEGVDQVSLKSLSQTVRVDLRKLDHLMNLVGELALVHANLGGVVDRQQRADRGNEFSREFQDQLRIMNRRLGLLQQGILEVRMVPLGQVFDKLARVVRRLSRELDKDVRLAISGADTELDKLIVEELSDPLMHMIRNAVDHGIEKPAERVALGKPRAGQIALSAYQKGNRVVIELTDDGSGMDWRRLRDKAVERGFLTREEAIDISPAQAVNLIFTPGFSTRDKASEISGRGFGMDVVKTNISKLSGMIDVASEPGRGSRFRITLPITLAIIQALVIETAGQTFCIPLNSVLESIMVQSEEIHTIEGHEVVSVRGRTLPLIHLSRVFELEDSEGREADRRMFYDRLYVVVVGLAQHRVGLVVDELLGQQDVVIKPIGKALRQVPGIAGATELGDNRTVLLIDVATLVSESVGGVEVGGGRGQGGWGDGW